MLNCSPPSVNQPRPCHTSVPATLFTSVTCVSDERNYPHDKICNALYIFLWTRDQANRQNMVLGQCTQRHELSGPSENENCLFGHACLLDSTIPTILERGTQNNSIPVQAYIFIKCQMISGYWQTIGLNVGQLFSEKPKKLTGH